jgi:hypothetical protein
MSGSLIWDTKFAACTNAGISWTPSVAKVCGLVKAAFAKPLISGFTRVEHLHPVLLNWIQHERAFINWIDRGRPEGEPLVDWALSERTFPTLLA